MIMLAVLDSYELTEFIKQDIPKPDDPDEAALWERVNGRIRSFIILNVTPSVLEHIKHFRVLGLYGHTWHHSSLGYHP